MVRVRIITLPWNMTGHSTALPGVLPNFRAIVLLQIDIPQSHCRLSLSWEYRCLEKRSSYHEDPTFNIIIVRKQPYKYSGALVISSSAQRNNAQSNQFVGTLLDYWYYCYYTLCTTKLLGGYIGFTPSVHPSVCPASRVHSVAPTVLVGSISYLYNLSSNFRKCVTCKFSGKISKFEFLAFFIICNFDFVLFWLGIWCE